MERYMKTCRIILTCDSASKIIPPLRSRCLHVRVGAPTLDQVQAVLMKTAAKEKLNLPPELALKIAQGTGRDVRRAVLMMEVCYTQANSFSKDTPLLPEAWETAVDKVVKKILQEQSPRIFVMITCDLPHQMFIY